MKITNPTVTHLQADRRTKTVGHNGSAREVVYYEVAFRAKETGNVGRAIDEANVIEAIADMFGWDTSGVRYAEAFPAVEFFHAQPSKRHNGLDTECRIFGRTIDGLRIPAITLANVLKCIGEYAAFAWAGAKLDAPVTNFDMTVERNTHG